MYKENTENQPPKRDCWERIETIIKRSEMTINAFARHIGLPRAAFAALIDKVSGRGTWERNPWVAVYEFELVK